MATFPHPVCVAQVPGALRVMHVPASGYMPPVSPVSPVSPRGTRTLQRLAELLERHRSELKQELHKARLVMQSQPSQPSQPSQSPVSPRCPRHEIPRGRLAAEPVTTAGACQVMLDRWDEPGSVAFTAREALRSHGGRSTLSSSASVPGLPALEQLHALADQHSAALSRLGQL
mmetsp:Transcript_39262/g.84526  ORF Transcript_39262/g.84526 Transcript_39262/m.84526 type:complete len:173 (+) Transcript_39262:48-566(+)